MVAAPHCAMPPLAHARALSRCVVKLLKLALGDQHGLGSSAMLAETRLQRKHVVTCGGNERGFASHGMKYYISEPYRLQSRIDPGIVGNSYTAPSGLMALWGQPRGRVRRVGARRVQLCA